MRSPLILDASALIALVKGETGSDKVLSVLHEANDRIFIHAVNAFEVAFKLMLWGISEDAAWECCTVSGAVKIEDVGDDVGRRAARLKVSNPHLSLGDCFCIALAEEMKGRVLTSDNGFSKAQTTAEVILLR